MGTFSNALSKLSNTGFWKRVGTLLAGFIGVDVLADNLVDLIPARLPFKATVASALVTAGIHSFGPSGRTGSDLTLGAGLGTASNFLEESGLNTVVRDMGLTLRSPVA